jgi:hypothetical protein
MTTEKLANLRSKYRNLPDNYYGGDTSKFTTPKHLQEYGMPPEPLLITDVFPKGAPAVKIWEIYSGSAALSSSVSDHKVSHLPPIDYRYGWNLNKLEHQEILLDKLTSFGTQTLFASPNCAPWGNHIRGLPKEQLQEKRDYEKSTLTFLAFACFIQVLLNRKYIVENSGYSDIFSHSPLANLRDLVFHLALLDQCTCGGELEGEASKKRTHFQSNQLFHHLQMLCKGGHKHLNLRGHGRAASSAQYPTEECRRIMLEAITPVETFEGGRFLPSHTLTTKVLLNECVNYNLSRTNEVLTKHGL